MKIPLFIEKETAEDCPYDCPFRCIEGRRFYCSLFNQDLKEDIHDYFDACYRCQEFYKRDITNESTD